MTDTMTKTAAVINGLDVTAMGETVKALQGDPTLARFEFRARNTAGSRAARTGRPSRTSSAQAARISPAASRSPSPTASRRYCSAATRARTPSSSCCTRLPGA